MAKYITLDLETNGETTYKRFCNPLDSRHTIQCVAYCVEGGTPQIVKNTDWSPSPSLPDEIFSAPILIGQNFKFDMLWLFRDSRFKDWISNIRHKVWDTQTVQYLLDGQDHSPRNLDALVERHGGTLKDDRIKALYTAGIQSKDIDPELLVPYALEDVKNTHAIFKKQYQKAVNRDLLPLIRVYMQHYLAVTEIEYNGMRVSVDLLLEKEKELTAEIGELENRIKDLSGIDNPNSAMQVANYVWGSTHDEEGNRRSADEKALEGVLKSTPEDSSVYEVLTAILLLRSKVKMLTTYINKVELYKEKKRRGQVKSHVGLVPLIHLDGCLHSGYETAHTVTGRLSSRNPNLQNLPKELLDAFISRSNKGGILEVDFSQLEVCVAAQLSGDGLLISEIINKVDFHRRNAAFLYEIPENEVTPEQRSLAKGLTFSLFYGAFASRMAADKNISEDLAQRFIDGFYDKYSDFKIWHSELEAEVRRNSRLTDKLLILKDKTTCNEMQQTSYIEMPWKKRYTFYDKGVRTRKGDIFRYWPTTDIKNLPVQGTASDLVNMMVGRVWRKLCALRDKVLLINEIHDSIILDVLDVKYLDEVVNLVKSEMTDVKRAWKEELNYDWIVPINVGVKFGKTWLSCKQSEEL